MSKLNPPLMLESKIPAFYGNTITIPFKHNPLVNIDSVSGMALKITTIDNTREYFYYTTTESIDTNSNSSITFNIEDEKQVLTVGIVYHIQIAYYGESTEDIGTYSQAVLAKYTSTPTFELNLTYPNIQATYSNADTTETIYQYQFIIIDKSNGDIIKDSGVLYDRDDMLYSYYGNWNGKKVICEAITINNLQLKKEIDLSSSTSLYYPTVNATLNLIQDKENGCVKLTMDNWTNGTKAKIKLLRSDDRNPDEWTVLGSYLLTSDTQFKYVDTTVEHGVTYQYGYQQYNDDGVHSIISSIVGVTADFEDIFLTDGEKQIRLAFNPKVTSFKETVLESKLDTIGGKYPFFFRNGDKGYKEFPISGLISYQLDPNELFMKRSQLGLKDFSGQRILTNSPEFTYNNYATTSLTSYNFAAERKFRLELLSWLNNGEPKLFRSPTEGNYLVRLMNISLSPEEKLGRMIWTMSGTAYECGKFEIAAGSLVEPEGLADKNQVLDSMKIETLVSEGGIISIDGNLKWIKIDGAVPGSTIAVGGKTYTIPLTGTLIIPDIESGYPPAAYTTTYPSGVINYAYEIEYNEGFDPTGSNVTLTNVSETISLDPTSTISVNNIYYIYNLIFEQDVSSKSSWFQINDGDKIHFSGSYTIPNPGQFGKITKILGSNTKMHIYYQKKG